MRLVDADKIKYHKYNKVIEVEIDSMNMEHVLESAYATIEDVYASPEIDPETLPIVQELRANIAIQEKIIESQHNPMDTDKIVKLSLENSDLKQQITRLEEARENANEACSKWEHKYNELNKENDELKQRIVFWNRDIIAQLTNENQELKQQLSKVTYERDSLKIYYNDLSSKPDCNTCKKQNCQYKPRIGSTTRVNCPLWEGAQEELKNDQKKV